MNYTAIYDNLINSRSNQPILKEQYYEKHHIIPRCLGGSDDSNNIVMLTAREHFLAHYLLTKIYPKEYKLFYALLCMIRDPHSNRKDTSRVYEIAKKQYANMQSVRQTENNMMWTEEARKKTSERMKGDNNPMRKEVIVTWLGDNFSFIAAQVNSYENLRRKKTEKNPSFALLANFKRRRA